MSPQGLSEPSYSTALIGLEPHLSESFSTFSFSHQVVPVHSWHAFIACWEIWQSLDTKLPTEGMSPQRLRNPAVEMLI